MKYKRSKIYALFAAVLVFVLACPATVLAAAEEEVSSPAVYATFWSLVPPVVAIVLALITKEVYSSLFVGILVGAILYSGGNFEVTVNQIFSGGMISVLSSSSNVGILVFLVILGTMVCLMNRAGGSAAFGRWASKHIKTRVGAELATILLGVLIFIDDYFNCLTVGSVMRPITDQHNVSRAKLAYLIDATSSAYLHYCADLILGGSSQRICTGRRRNVRFCESYSLQLLCNPYHCDDGVHGSDERRVWLYGRS